MKFSEAEKGNHPTQTQQDVEEYGLARGTDLPRPLDFGPTRSTRPPRVTSDDVIIEIPERLSNLGPGEHDAIPSSDKPLTLSQADLECTLLRYLVIVTFLPAFVISLSGWAFDNKEVRKVFLICAATLLGVSVLAALIWVFVKKPFSRHLFNWSKIVPDKN